jgi:hypothetical protein
MTRPGSGDWLEGLLGGAPDGHPSSAQLCAHAAGELSAEERDDLAQHLQGCASCRELHHAARAGLDEAERIERGLALAAALRADPRAAAPDTPIHLPLAVAPAPAARALAATADAEPAPCPADRRVVLEQPGLYRVVYFREGADARLGLFADGRRELALELEVQLDGEVLRASVDDPEALVFDLGKLAALAGRTLELRLRRGGEPLAVRSFTVVEETP